VTDVFPELVHLDHPRAPAEHERVLLDFLLQAPGVTPELRRLARLAEVIGVCSCGCPSITFKTSAEMPEVAIQPPGDDPLVGQMIFASGVTPDGRNLDVHLAVDDTRHFELEIWAQGVGDPHTELPDVTTLRLF
jgi:hypothetical protein